MGLDIFSKSDREYHASYSALHQIRWMAYKAQDGEKSYADWHQMQRKELDVDWAMAYCYLFYPNLYWHSDCDGTYTLRGKIDMMTSKHQTGNSKQLLWELADIKQMLTDKPDDDIHEYDWQKFDMLYELVKDVVENHDGRLEFS